MEKDQSMRRNRLKVCKPEAVGCKSGEPEIGDLGRLDKVEDFSCFSRGLTE